MSLRAVLTPAIPSPINSASNASTMAPISAVVRTAIAIAVAWIGVTVSRIAVRIRRRVGWVTRNVGWVASVAWLTGTNLDANALGGCFERHKHRQAKSNGADENGG